MKKTILISVVLSLSAMSMAFAATGEPSIHLGEERLSEISPGSFKCEFARGNIEKEIRSYGSAPSFRPASAGSAKARS